MLLKKQPLRNCFYVLLSLCTGASVFVFLNLGMLLSEKFMSLNALTLKMKAATSQFGAENAYFIFVLLLYCVVARFTLLYNGTAEVTICGRSYLNRGNSHTDLKAHVAHDRAHASLFQTVVLIYGRGGQILAGEFCSLLLKVGAWI